MTDDNPKPAWWRTLWRRVVTTVETFRAPASSLLLLGAILYLIAKELREPGINIFRQVVLGVAGGGVAYSLGLWSAQFQRNQRLSMRKHIEELSRSTTSVGGSNAGNTADWRRRENAVTRDEGAASRAVVPFENEADRAKSAARLNQIIGALIVAGVIGLGVRDWSEGTAQNLSTGDGIARVGVITAAFFLAGQFFRRANVLASKGSEFERAAIAMRVTKELAEQLTNPDERDKFIRSVYQSHLARPGNTPDNSAKDDDKNSTLTAAFAEAIAAGKKTQP